MIGLPPHLQATLEGLVRVGRVSERGGDGRVRVTWPDRDGIESPLLQVLHPRAHAAGDLCIPDVGEAVVCLMLPPEEIDGFVLGAVYDRTQSPPSPDPQIRVISGDPLRLGSVGASHPLAYGELVQRVVRALVDLLQTAAPIGNLGVPVSFATDLTAQSALYPLALGIPALTAAIDGDTDFASPAVSTD